MAISDKFQPLKKKEKPVRINTQCYDFLVYLKTYSAFLFLNHTVFTRKVVVKTPKYIIIYYYKTGIFATSIRWLYRITFLQFFKKNVQYINF